MRIVCFGPGPRFKGGISNYNTSLAKALDRRGDCEVHIVSWTQQYPAIIPREFVDKRSKTDLLEGTDIRVHYLTNYNNPLSWRRTVEEIAALRPDKVILQWAIAVQGLPMGYMARRLRRRYPEIEVVYDLHNVVQKEGSSLDRYLTRYGLAPARTLIAHAAMTLEELRRLFPERVFTCGPAREDEVQVLKLYHPVYELFAPREDFDVAAFKRMHNLREHVFLFFGFIRKYKGLHDVIRAFARLAGERDDVSLIVCGESFLQQPATQTVGSRLKSAIFSAVKAVFLAKSADTSDYRPLTLIDELGIRDRVLVVNEFIPNEEVHQYFQVSDALLLFYSYATPSGVESIGYNFALPPIATRTGHFAETIRDGYNGYLAEPGDLDDMVRQLQRMIEQPIPRDNIRATTKEMSWENYAAAIVGRPAPPPRK